MVCLGNICRSPLAEGVLMHKVNQAGLNLEVDSAGTNGYHVGESPHHLSQKVAKKRGIDIGRQVARRFNASDFEKFDKIYVMAEDVLHDVKRIAGAGYKPEKVDFFLNELWPGQNADVPDPWYGAEDGYEEVFELIDKTCEQIVRKYQF